MRSNVSKLILIIFVLLMQIGCLDFFFKSYKMAATSMQPTINKGDRVFANLSYYQKNKPKRGDIIVFKFPKDPKKHWISRIVAFAGETIEIKDGKLFINGNLIAQTSLKKRKYANVGEYGAEDKAVIIPKYHFFVLGDNSSQSFDSRFWGFLPKENIIGKVTNIYWPISRFGYIE